ncbi:hypothetical protein [Hymenobacter coalescens]
MRATVILAAALFLPALPSLAQEEPVALKPLTPAASYAPGRTVVRFDAAAVLLSNVDYNFWGHKDNLLPVLVSAERHLGHRTSVVVEGLLNGGTPDTRRTGFSVQGRYYLQRKFAGLPLGLYVAPALSYRAVRDNPHYSTYDVRKKFGGAGALLGVQVPVGLQGRLVLDAAAGVMVWQQVGQARVYDKNISSSEYFNLKPIYELSPVLPDLRVGLGVRF